MTEYILTQSFMEQYKKNRAYKVAIEQREKFGNNQKYTVVDNKYRSIIGRLRYIAN